MSIHNTHHHTLLYTAMILPMKTFFTPSCHPRKIYLCMTAHSTQYHTLLNNSMILHIEKCFAPSCHLRKNIFFTSKYDKNSNSNIPLLYSSGLGLGLGLRPKQPLTHNWYTSLHTTAQVASYFYFYIICK